MTSDAIALIIAMGKPFCSSLCLVRFNPRTAGTGVDFRTPSVFR